MDTNKRFREITKEMADLCEKKNKDYGSSVHDTYLDFGIVAFLVRMQDKLNRLKTTTKQKAEILDESTKDTLIDLANYAILAVIELEGDKK